MIESPPPGTSLALDSDVFNDWRFLRPKTIESITQYQAERKDLPALTSFTVFESLIGFEKQASQSALQESQRQARRFAENLVRSCTVLPFDQAAAEIAAYIFGRMGHAQGNRLRKDVFIASTAIAHGYGLVSRNRRDFELIADLVPAGRNLYLEIWKR